VSRFHPRRILLGLAAPALALLFALLVASVILLITGHQPLETFGWMWDYGTQPDSIVLTINLAVGYYLAAVAVAIGFRMNLFNIGVDGQYRLAALIAAGVAGAIHLAPIISVAITIVVAMLVGAAWAAIAAVLKVKRGVSEVISTIMLNYIANAVIGYLLVPGRMAVNVSGSEGVGTAVIPPSGRVPGISMISGATTQVYGLAILAVVIGVGYWFLLSRTRFGFDLRATGRSETAAVASGVNVKRMVVISLLISGAVAGLIGIPNLLGESYSYSQNFPAGIGFVGISVALLGRNNPLGMAFGALLWAFLDNARQILDLHQVSKEVVTIMQAVAVLSVVVAYELVRRYNIRRQQREVARTLDRQPEAVAA
jgi:general nucleoside transport system permease protein